MNENTNYGSFNAIYIWQYLCFLYTDMNITLYKNKTNLPKERKMYTKYWKIASESTYRWQHRIHPKSRSTKSTWLCMFHSTRIPDMTQQPCQKRIMTYCWAVTYNCHVFPCSCYCNIHPSTIPQKPNSPQSIWSNLNKIKMLKSLFIHHKKKFQETIQD